ncbi:hypothetical protein VTJ49DRAFT_1533 [Mycothermus thermophilus]|uniref:Ankyrin n=1 Tax=Humicola insolens TaxID=85995 RepID=A0ABR3VD09_HUMIN
MFSDLAPLLTLFGERVTTQFMTQSTGWADTIILAVAPLGVITIIVGAIRVSGPSWLKAIIGRARESRAVAEAELMSSTSNEVCELWKGQQIVRVMGQGPIREFLILMPKEENEGGEDRGRTVAAHGRVPVVALKDAMSDASNTGDDGEGPDKPPHYLEEHILTNNRVDDGIQEDPEKGCRSSDPETNDVKDCNQTTSKRPVVVVRNSPASSPNLALNVHNQVSRGELYVVAAIGIVLQLGVLVYAGIAAYHFHPVLLDDGDPVESYAFPCTVAGTLLLVVGTLICAHVVESSTSETRLRPIDGMELRLVWLQKHGTVNDQAFDSFAIFPETAQPLVTTSHRADEESSGEPNNQVKSSTLAIITREGITVAGTLISICGFVAQFTGLREPHQDGRNRSPDDDGAWDWSINTVEDPEERGKLSSSRPARRSKLQEVMMIRRDLGEMTAWPGPAAVEAVALARAIEVVMDTLFGPDMILDSVVTWSLPAINSSGSICPDSLTFCIEMRDGRWKAFADELDAALSLWLYSVKDFITTVNAKGDEWLRTKGTLEKSSLRLLGQRTETLNRDLHWWAPEAASRVIEVQEFGQEIDANMMPWEIEVMGCGNHRIVGFVPNTKGSYVRNIGHNQWEQFHAYKLWSSDSPTENALLAVESRVPLGVLYTQHMFTAFMWSAAKTLAAPIWGETDLRPLQQGGASGDSAWKEFSLHNTRLSRMAREIQDAGLASLDDVYLSIIPPLSMANKLPEPNSIIDLARARAKPFEESGRWKGAAEAYLWLFRETKMFSENSYVRTKATALLADFHRAITFAITMKTALDVEESVIKEMEDLKREVRQELLEGPVEDILWGINGLYGLQGRRWGSALSDWAEPLLMGETARLKLYTRRHEDIWQKEDGTSLYFGDPITCENAILRLVAQALVERGADIRAIDANGCTPLHWAVFNDDYVSCSHTVRYLVKEAGANLETKTDTRRGWTPLHFAAAQGEKDVAKVFIEVGADKEAKDNLGRTPLHIAVEKRHEALVKFLIEMGADMEAKDFRDLTPLLLAAKEGQEACLRVLVEMGADTEARDELRQTPLHLAAISGSMPIVKYLIEEAGADKDARDIDEKTPLRHAVTGQKHIAKYLFEQHVRADNAEPHVTNNPPNHTTPTRPAAQDDDDGDSNTRLTGEVLSQLGDSNGPIGHLQQPRPRCRYVCYFCRKDEAPRQEGFARQDDLDRHLDVHYLPTDAIKMYLELCDNLGGGSPGSD